MTIKEFQEVHKDFCNKYNEVLDLYYRCGEYVESPERTTKEIDKYLKIMTSYTKTLSIMMMEYKELTGEELSNRIILGGFLQYDKVQ
ncbi:hypothetical protein [Clostridium sp.]